MTAEPVLVASSDRFSRTNDWWINYHETLPVEKYCITIHYERRRVMLIWVNSFSEALEIGLKGKM